MASRLAKHHRASRGGQQRRRRCLLLLLLLLFSARRRLQRQALRQGLPRPLPRRPLPGLPLRLRPPRRDDRGAGFRVRRRRRVCERQRRRRRAGRAAEAGRRPGRAAVRGVRLRRRRGRGAARDQGAPGPDLLADVGGGTQRRAGSVAGAPHPARVRPRALPKLRAFGARGLSNEGEDCWHLGHGGHRHGRCSYL